MSKCDQYSWWSSRRLLSDEHSSKPFASMGPRWHLADCLGKQDAGRAKLYALNESETMSVSFAIYTKFSQTIGFGYLTY
jgi:hypothetical protein